MRRRPHLLACLVAPLLALALPVPARAEQFRTFGEYEVHFNAVRSDFIAPEAAAQHGLTRSATRGLLNVAILRRKADGGQVHSEATLTVSGATIHADATDGDMYAAIDALVDKLDRRVARHRDKRNDHHAAEAPRGRQD